MRERKLNRLDGFDYSRSRHYYITICVKDRIQSFVIIKNLFTHLSPKGFITMEQWNWLGDRYRYIDLISFVITK